MKRCGSVSDLRKSTMVWIISLAGAVAGDQPVDDVLMNLDLSLLHQRVLHAGFEEGGTVAGALALDLIANYGAGISQFGHVGRGVGDHFAHDGRAIRGGGGSKGGAIGFVEGSG